MNKTVPFRQPTADRQPAPAGEAWVDPKLPVAAAAAILPTATAAPAVPLTRMSFDVPKSLHVRFKMQCLRRGKHEYEIGTEIMERAVAELEKE